MEEEKYERLIAAVFICLALLAVFILLNFIRVKNIRYKYFRGEEIGISNECYVDNHYGCMCKIDNAFRAVDAYYEE